MISKEVSSSRRRAPWPLSNDRFWYLMPSADVLYAVEWRRQSGSFRATPADKSIRAKYKNPLKNYPDTSFTSAGSP